MECGLDGGLAVVGVFINSIAIKNMENKMQLNLEVDEEIVWIGNPNKKLTFTRGDVFILPLSIIFIPLVGFIINALYHTKNLNLGWYSINFIMVLAIYFYITFGRKIQDLYYKSKIDYIITNKKILITNENSKAIVLSKNLTEIRASFSKFSDGFGTIDLGISISPESLNAFKYGWPSKVVISNRFENIANASEVFELLLKAQKNHLQS